MTFYGCSPHNELADYATPEELGGVSATIIADVSDQLADWRVETGSSSPEALHDLVRAALGLPVSQAHQLPAPRSPHP